MSQRAIVRQNDFAFGEVSPDFAAAGDRDAVRRSLKKGRNIRLLNSFGFKQRPGSRRLETLEENAIIANLITSTGAEYIAAIRDGAIDIYDEEGALQQSVTSLADWDADQIDELTWLTRENELYIAHKSLWPRVLSYDTEARTWSLALFAFSSGAGSSKAQLYYRFADRDIGLTPSARTGTINIEFTDDVLTADHVGTRFRYGADPTVMKEIQVATVIDAQHGTATVIDELPPTYEFDVADASGFRPGEEVQGLDSKARGVISAIASNTLQVLMISGFEGFMETSGSEEYIVGPTTRSKIVTGTQSIVSPTVSAVWDEQVFSEVRGYPGDVFERSGRLGFTDFPQIPDGIALSAPSVVTDFDLGSGEAGDAIFVTIGGAGRRIKYCVSSANLIVLTDRDVGYIPEDSSVPLAFNTFAFIPIGPTGTSGAFPVVIEEGIAYIESGGNRVMAVLATGDLSSPWRLLDISEHAPHLIDNPIALAQTNGNEQAPERYIFVLNGDGTVACLFFKTSPPHEGWTRWETDGTWRSFATIKGVIYICCEREIAGSTVFFLEKLDADAQLDASAFFLTPTGNLPLETDDGPIETDDGILMTDNGSFLYLAGQTVDVIRGTEYLGSHEVNSLGAFDDIDAEDGNFEAGLHFNINATRWPAEPAEDERPMFGRRRVAKVAVRTESSASYQVGLEGRDRTQIRPTYDQGDDISEAPPLRSEIYRFNIPGWEHEPCIQIKRPIPVPVQILSIAEEVAF